MNTNHSRLPWYIGYGGHPEKIQIVVCESKIHNEPTGLVAEVNKRIQFEPGTGKSEVAEANAQYIVQACNAYPALVEALEGMLARMEYVCAQEDKFRNILLNGRPSRDGSIKQARAALALARGGVVDGQGVGTQDGGEKGGE